LRHRQLLAGLGLALALGTALVPAAGWAGTVSRLDPAALRPLAVPGSAPGVERHWVQLMWNPVSRRLERVRYTAFDPIAALGLELEWLADDGRVTPAGAITGTGTLTFRRPGAAAYDPSGIVATYRGSLVDGRAEGQGSFHDATGFAYAGGWHAGLMAGEGRLSLANGDEYVGSFRAGKREGQGVLTLATGQVLAGDFVGGAPAAGIRMVDFPAVDGLRIGVVAERRPHNYELGLDPLSYTSRADGQGLAIFPDDQRLLDAWHGAAPITMTPAEQEAFDDPATTPSFLGPYERFDPLSLVFELENTTTDTVAIVGGFLDVATSRRNPEPAMQIRPFPRDPCAGIIEFLPRFFIDNFGWAPADNAVLNFTAGAVDGRTEGTPVALPLGDIAQSTLADVTDTLVALGLDVDLLANERLTCSDPNDERLCLAELRQSGHFGQLADYISLDYMTVTVAVMGTLDYDWTGADGAVAHKRSPFSLTLPVASVANDAECGEGGEIVPVLHDPFMLRLDADNYRIAIPFAGDVAPGFTARWRIQLRAPETSEHDFDLVLLLADGRQVGSRPVHLSYFMPPDHDVLWE
jgi:hypothetical protein